MPGSGFTCVSSFLDVCDEATNAKFYQDSALRQGCSEPCRNQVYTAGYYIRYMSTCSGPTCD
jgi:hypothetical protein